MKRSFKDTFLHMFVQDKVEQKPKEELSIDELLKEAQWIASIYLGLLKELRRRGAGNAALAKVKKMTPEDFWSQASVSKEELNMLYEATEMSPAIVKVVVDWGNSHVEI